MGAYPLYITEGDPSSVSPELIHLEYNFIREISKTRPVFLFRGKNNHNYTVDQNIGYADFLKNPKQWDHGYISVEVGEPHGFSRDDIEYCFGKPSLSSGYSSYHVLRAGMEAIQERQGDLITLPLSKEWVIRSGVNHFSGHTEELAYFFSKKTFMLMHGKNWNIIPLTTHIPLKKVPGAIQNVPWDTLLTAIRESKLFPEPLKIAYLGLNPHAGEGGKIGQEEIEILAPAMEKWSHNNVKTFGPLPADSAFLGTSRPDWDLCLALYHDQGLIPFKLLEGKDGINVTLGLPFLRVSPDHGTAYDIAGKNQVDSTSFRRCLEFLTK